MKELVCIIQIIVFSLCFCIAFKITRVFFPDLFNLLYSIIRLGMIATRWKNPSNPSTANSNRRYGKQKPLICDSTVNLCFFFPFTVSTQEKDHGLNMTLSGITLSEVRSCLTIYTVVLQRKPFAFELFLANASQVITHAWFSMKNYVYSSLCARLKNTYMCCIQSNEFTQTTPSITKRSLLTVSSL